MISHRALESSEYFRIRRLILLRTYPDEKQGDRFRSKCRRRVIVFTSSFSAQGNGRNAERQIRATKPARTSMVSIKRLPKINGTNVICRTGRRRPD